MKTQYHYVGDNVSGRDRQIIKKYNLSNEVAEVINVINTERAYNKLMKKEENIDGEETSTILFDYRNRKVITNFSVIEAATVVLKNNIDKIRENELSWKAKLVMIFSHLIDHNNHYSRSTKHEEEAKQFFNKYVYEEKQIDLIKADKDYKCNFELKFVPQEDRQQQICQDFCKILNSLYVGLDLHFENV